MAAFAHQEGSSRHVDSGGGVRVLTVYLPRQTGRTE